MRAKCDTSILVFPKHCGPFFFASPSSSSVGELSFGDVVLGGIGGV